MTTPRRIHMGQGHRSAQPTVVDDIRFPSKTEARVFRLLSLEAQASGAQLFRQVRLPLFNLSPDDKFVPRWITIDFALRYPDNTVRFIDAKCRTWKSRDWLRGKAAFEGWYGVPIEQMDGRAGRNGRSR